MNAYWRPWWEGEEGGGRKSPLLIITVEDDVRCCLSMFRINFRWTKTAGGSTSLLVLMGGSFAFLDSLGSLRPFKASAVRSPPPPRFEVVSHKRLVCRQLTYLVCHKAKGLRAVCANRESFVWTGGSAGSRRA